MPNIDWKKLGFEYLDTACHIRHTWRDGVWDDGELISDPTIRLPIAASCLHYGQAAFEGLKGFCRKDGSIQIFRPHENARRMARTAVRTCMAPVPESMFVEAVRRVVDANRDYVPPYGSGGSIYIRPLLIGSGIQIGVAPAREYTFLVLVMPVGAYYKGGLTPVRSLIVDDYDRAAPLGMGDVKVAGNYAASLYAHEQAKAAGYPVELYLDAQTHTHIEEFATSNFIGIKPDGTYVTPDSRSVLPSVTNDTLKQLATDFGMKVETRPIPYEELTSFSEVAACGTAVVVTPVYEITRGETVLTIGPSDRAGPVVQKLFDAVQGVQYGERPDVHGWCMTV